MREIALNVNPRMSLGKAISMLRSGERQPVRAQCLQLVCLPITPK